MECVIGIDGGGSTTRCNIVSLSGNIIAEGISGPSNYHSMGITRVVASIHESLCEAVESSELQNNFCVIGICLGLAGIGNVPDIKIARRLIDEIESTSIERVYWQLKSYTKLVFSDYEVALTGALEDQVGIVVIVGTGSIVFGRNQYGITKRVGGFGYCLGDEGSAYNVALHGMRSALRASDGRAQSTVLTNRIPEHLRLNSIEEIVDLFYSEKWSVKDTAALAPIICQAAEEKDLVALDIIDTAISEITLSTKTASSYLFEEEAVVKIAALGGFWKISPFLLEYFMKKIADSLPKATIILPKEDPVYGSALKVLNVISKFKEIHDCSGSIS